MLAGRRAVQGCSHACQAAHTRLSGWPCRPRARSTSRWPSRGPSAVSLSSSAGLGRHEIAGANASNKSRCTQCDSTYANHDEMTCACMALPWTRCVAARLCICSEFLRPKWRYVAFPAKSSAGQPSAHASSRGVKTCAPAEEMVTIREARARVGSHGDARSRARGFCVRSAQIVPLSQPPRDGTMSEYSSNRRRALRCSSSGHDWPRMTARPVSSSVAAAAAAGESRPLKIEPSAATRRAKKLKKSACTSAGSCGPIQTRLRRSTAQANKRFRRMGHPSASDAHAQTRVLMCVPERALGETVLGSEQRFSARAGGSLGQAPPARP